MGSSTLAHAGFLVYRKDIDRIIPRSKEFPDCYEFGTHVHSPFLPKHYAQLIGKSFKTKIKTRASGVRRAKNLTYTLEVNPPLENRSDFLTASLAYSLVLSSRECRIEFPVPEGEQPQTVNHITCCGKVYLNLSGHKFCGRCGKKLPKKQTTYVDSLYDLCTKAGISSPLEKLFDLREHVTVAQTIRPATFHEAEPCNLANAIAKKVGAVSCSIHHLKDLVFIFSPLLDRGTMNVDLWESPEPYIKLDDIIDNRKEIDAVGERLKQLGFNTSFVIHPEWQE